MAGGKLSPRQKMINMMYLVLTALLAMNVSKEILNSFAILNKGLVVTNQNFTAKNAFTYAQFDNAYLTDPNKVKPLRDKALAVKERAESMYEYIEEIKQELIRAIEQKDSIIIETEAGKDSMVRLVLDIAYMDGKDNYDIPTHYFMGESVGEAVPGTKAYEFKEKINNFKDDLMNILDERDRKGIRLGLETSNVFSAAEGKKVTWEVNNFYHNPAAAVIAILSKMQNDVKNAEADIINTLYNKIDANTFKFDVLEGRVIAKSNYVLIGEEYNAQIFVAGFSTTSNPQIWLCDVDSAGNINGPIDSTTVKVNNGVGHLAISPTTEATTPVKGVIRMKKPGDPNAPPQIFPFFSEFKSAKPALVVSPDAMNVFYIGLDNPVSVSVPGIATEDLQVTVSGGNISGSRGKYTIRPSSGVREATVNVSAKTAQGTKSMGPGAKFRVKPVPDPVPEFAGKRGTDNIPQAQLKVVSSVKAALDNFEFNVAFPVVSFNVSMTVNGQVVEEKANGGSLTNQQKGLLAKARKGNKIYIESVKVKKPDGTIKDIGSVILRVI